MYSPSEVEKEILEFWGKNKVFEKLRKQNQKNKKFSFFDGPITANNPMGVHHAWGRTYKDLFQRFKAMQGYDERYQNGFDCQGLWVEVEVEKDLGFNSKKDIENFGLDKFSKECRKRVEKFSKIQTEQSIRLGQWMDWENSYYTLADNNIEHIWHFLKKCHEKKWLVKNTRVMPWCYRCGTSLSQHELIDSYKEMEHTAVYVKFPIKDKRNEFLLIWTTTAWTLSSNVAAAVNPDLDYVKIKQGYEIYYLSEKTSSKLKEHFDILEKFKGKQLVGLEYEGPFDELESQKNIIHKVIAWNDVGEEEGTGIVHIAPGCGQEDNELGKKEKLKEISPLDESGFYKEEFGWLTGKNVKGITKDIVADLTKKRKLHHEEKYKHRYPVCWRCKEELVFRLVSEWFITCNEIRPLMKKEAAKVTWYPEHAGKLMQDWLNNMGDWCISRKRFWGLPLMFYECSCSHLEIIGSLKELKEKAVDPKSVDSLPELHKPWIDKIKIRCSKCGKAVSRVPDVGDCWLDAGIVPFSTLNYLKDKPYWKKWFPAEFITEMREQIRLWFYSMLFMSVTLENKSPYQSVLVYEKLQDEKGSPMHKSAGNAIWFDDAVEKIGADIMRWMYSTQNPSYNLNFGYTPAKEVKKQLDVIWNLGNYTNIYCQDKGTKENNLDPVDKWIISRRESTKKEVKEYLELLQPHQAMRSLQNFILEDLSRSYGQFIRETLEQSSVQRVLYNTYLDSIKMLAPFTPFIAEKIYQDISKKEISIFLEKWPEANTKLIDKNLEWNMIFAKEIIQAVLAQRDKAQIGIRWPLKSITVFTKNKNMRDSIKMLESVIKKQTNIKELIVDQKDVEKYEIEIDTSLSPELEKEGFTREVIRRIQALRKKAELKKEDKIILEIKSQVELDEKAIKEAVGASSIKKVDPKFSDKFKVKEKDIEIKIQQN
ncbi:isoleucine--tRNA ligase [Candidatus Woesearchaeota archaeon]|nr:isoleucine--tRNA ligase [Candidatus Woesearchaeota archaeon]